MKMIQINEDRINSVDFKLLGKIEYLIEYVDVYLFSSFPKTEKPLKLKIENYLYSLLEVCATANINTGSIRNKYQKEMLSKIVVLDFLFGYTLDKKIIKEGRFYGLINCLNEIKGMTYGWINEK